MSNHLDYEINKELGECYLFMGDLDKAEDYYRKAALSNGESVAPYLGLATIAVQRGKMDEAMVLYLKAASIEETDKTLSGIGLVHMEQGRHQEAFDFFSKALKCNPENMVAMNCLVREGYELSCVDQVVPFLRACLDVAPGQESVRVTLAGCLITLGQKDEARAELEAVLGSNPANAGAREIIETMAA